MAGINDPLNADRKAGMTTAELETKLMEGGYADMMQKKADFGMREKARLQEKTKDMEAIAFDRENMAKWKGWGDLAWHITTREATDFIPVSKVFKVKSVFESLVLDAAVTGTASALKESINKGVINSDSLETGLKDGVTDFVQGVVVEAVKKLH